MEKYILTDSDIELLKNKLHTRSSYKEKANPDSIMEFENICDHNGGFFCEHRLNWLIDFIKNKREC